LMNWLTHWPIGIASCISGLLVAQVLQQDRLSHRSHVDAVAVDDRERMRVPGHLPENLPERTGTGERRHVGQQRIRKIGFGLAQQRDSESIDTTPTR